MRLFVQIGTHDFFVTFRHLSGRERSQVILAGAMILANQLAKQQATLLVIDLASTFLPGELLSFYAEKFADPEFRFQTLLVHHSDRKDVNWSGWSFVRLTGRPPGVTIEQNNLD